jgi:hypothetical protein
MKKKQFDFITSEAEENELNEKEEAELEEEDNAGKPQPITGNDHIEEPMDVCNTV